MKQDLQSLSPSPPPSDPEIILKYKNFFINDNYNNLIQHLKHHEISKIYINNNYKQLIFVDNFPNHAGAGFSDAYEHFHRMELDPILLKNVIDKTVENDIPLYIVNFDNAWLHNIEMLLKDVANFIFYPLPFLFFLSIFLNVLRFNNRMNRNRMNNNVGKMSSWNTNNPFAGNIIFGNDNQMTTSVTNVTLDDWAGSPEVIEECKDVISYLENKDLYRQIGAEMPKGILLEGPPGTGKTLLAKAIAGETKYNFISLSASEFVELFVGMGAAKVRDLFARARENKPTILFIDEIDAVGGQRGSKMNLGNGNDERDQTLNQLLYEMDGFNDNEDIVVMAATNRKEYLDQALLRPGRFDRIIRIPLPDQTSREKIIGLYLKNKKTETKFNLPFLAEMTDGFSGAQLKNLINEASILSVRNNHTTLQEKYIFESLEKSVVGLVKKNDSLPRFSKSRVAIHECGHAFMVLKFKEYFQLQKISIQSTYNGAAGYTLFSELPEIKNEGLYTKDVLKKRLMIMMGGKAAESLYFGNDYVSLGSVQDLSQANQLAKKMIQNFGMGVKLEVFFNEDVNDNPYSGGNYFGNKYSEQTKRTIDKETMNLVTEAFTETKILLSQNMRKLVELSDLLEKKSVLYKNEIVDSDIWPRNYTQHV